MKKILSLFLIIIIGTSSSLGCGKSEKIDIEKRAIIMSVGYDLSKDGRFIVTLQAIKPQTKSEKGGTATQAPSDVIIHCSSGRTVNEAFDEVSGKLGKQPYFSHEKFIIIGEALARNGIELVVDSSLRGKETRPNVPIFVCRDYANEYIKTRGIDESIPSDELINIMELQGKKGFTFLTSPVELYNSISQKDSYSVTGVVSFDRKKVGEVTSDIFNISGSAILKKDKLVAFLDKQETKAVAFVKNKVKTGDVTVQIPNNPKEIITLEIASANSKIKPIINGDDIAMEIIIKVNSNIAETNLRVNPRKDPEVIHKIEKLENEEIKKQIEAVVYKLQKEYKMDVLGFGEAVRKDYPKVWKNKKDKWNDIFTEIPVDIKVESHIELTGSISKPAY